MNFFEYQRQARRNTQLLVVLFVLAVLAIVAAVSFLVLIVWTAQLSHQGLQSQWMFQKVFMYTAPLVAGVIGLVSLTRISNLGGSGRKVAEFLGAERLELDANDPKDRVLRHVVEEMAIASGMPVPEIYVLREEGGINAFAAGSEPGDAVIGVTQGTIDHLSRDEMQGVVAHEFSHIFNGDMKLNVRLMGTLAGILFLSTIGRGLVRGLPRSRFRSRSRKGDGTAALLFLGLGLMIIGWIGVFFGRWIKAAVSRQREFLADASAVQFTRNPAGLAGALAKISQNGSSVEEARAEEASHFFFSSIKTFFLFSTHPPLEERLQRLGVVRVSEPRFARKDPEPDIVKRVGRPEARDLLVATTVIQGLSAAVRVSAHKPRAAMEMVLGVLAEEAQRPDVMQRLDPAIREAIRAVPSEHRLALVDLALPALRRLDPMHAANLIQTIEVLVKEDNKMSSFEIAVLCILRRQLMGSRRRGRRAESLRTLMPEALVVLKALALETIGADDPASSFGPFAAGASRLGMKGQGMEQAWKTEISDGLAIDRALARLCWLPPMEKQMLFESLCLVANSDKKLTPAETQYLRAFSEALEIPLPRAGVTDSGAGETQAEPVSGAH